MKCDIWLAVNTWVLDSHPSPPPGNGRYHVRRDCYFTCLREYCHWITIHNVSVKFLKWLDWTRKSIIVCEENAFVPRTHLVQIVTCLNPLTMIGVKGYCKIWQFPGFFIWMAWMAGMLYLYLSFFFLVYLPFTAVQEGDGHFLRVGETQKQQQIVLDSLFATF